MDSAAFRSFMSNYPTGVCIITSLDNEGVKLGMTIGTFTSVSLNPPLIGFFPDQGSRTWQSICTTGRFCVNILAENQDDLCHRFSSSRGERFADLAHGTSCFGLPILHGAVAWIDCVIYSQQEAGDHFLILGKVEAMASESSASPLIFHRGIFAQLNPRDLTPKMTA